MEKIWTFEDYVERTKHSLPEVRYWAFERLTEQYPREAVEAVAPLLHDDEGEYTAGAVARFLGNMKAAGYASQLLDRYQTAGGTAPCHCAVALAKIDHQEAIPVLIKRLTKPIDQETFLGTIEAITIFGTDECRSTLEGLFRQLPTKHRLINDYVAGVFVSEDYFGHLKEGLRLYFRKVQDHSGILGQISHILGAGQFAHFCRWQVSRDENDWSTILTSAGDELGIPTGALLDDNGFIESLNRCFKEMDRRGLAELLAAKANRIISSRYNITEEIETGDLVPATTDDNGADRVAISAIDRKLCYFLNSFSNACPSRSRLDDDAWRTEASRLMGTLLALVDGIDYDRMPEQCQNDEDKCLQCFFLDRENVPNAIVEQVVAMGEKVEDRLIRHLYEEQETRSYERAVKALGDMKSRKAMDALIHAATTRVCEYSLGDTVNEAIAKIGEPALQPLWDAFKGGTETAIYPLWYLLEHLPIPESVEIAGRILEDDMAELDVLLGIMEVLAHADFIAPLNEQLDECEESIGRTLVIIYGVNGIDNDQTRALRKRVQELAAERIANSPLHQLGQQLMEAEARKRESQKDSGKSTSNNKGRRRKKNKHRSRRRRKKR